MMIALHKQARTTPAVRAEIAASTDSVNALACRYGVTEATIYKWKSRESVQDRSHTAHHLQTTLTPAQETIVVHLRQTLLLPLDVPGQSRPRAQRQTARATGARGAAACAARRCPPGRGSGAGVLRAA